MRSFLTRFILVAVIGTTVIYFVTPELRPYLANVSIRWPALRGGSGPLAGTNEPSLAVTSVPERVVTDRRPPAPTVPPGEVKTGPAADRTSVGSAPIPGAEDGTPDSSMDVLSPAAPGRWGVVWKADSPAYDRSGKYLGRLGAGTRIDISGDARSGDRVFLLGRILVGVGQGTEVAVSADGVNVITGLYASASVREQDLQLKKARIQAEIEVLKHNDLRTENPYADSYDTARRAFQEHWAKAEEILEKFNQDGPDRMTYVDQLRRLKGDEDRVRNALDLAKKAYNDWNAAHPISSETPPRLTALMGEMASIEQELTALTQSGPTAAQ